MHIVFLTSLYPKPNLNGGGIGTFVQFLANKLVEKNISVSVVGINNSNNYEQSTENSINIYRLPRSKWKFGKFYEHTKFLLKKIDEINQKNKIDIIEGSELGFSFFPKSTTYAKIIRLHGGHHFFSKELNKNLSFWRAYQEKKSFKKADAFVAVSNYVGEKTKKYLNHNFNYSTIYNFIDTDKFKPKSTNSNNNSLLFVGTICRKKGVEELVNAIPKIKKHYPNIKLDLVGSDWLEDGKSFTEYLKSIIRQEDLPNINFVGQISNDKIPKMMQETTVCVYPSHMESFGLTWLEALCMGKPLILGDVGPAKELAINNKTAILINPYNADEIAEGILKFLSDKSFREIIGNNARKDILKRFDSEEIVDKNINFYKSIILSSKNN